MRSFQFLFKHPVSRHHLLAVLLFAGIVVWSVPAAAAGFFFPTRGVEATARGGANVAPHRADLNALWYNPAGLSLVDDLQLTVDVAVVGMQVEHQRAPRQMDDGSVRTYETVHNQAPPHGIPQIVIGGNTPHADIKWGFGLYTHYTGTSRYPADGPQRYVLIDDVGSGAGYIHLAAAWQVTDRIAIGAGLQNFMGGFRIVGMGSGYTGMFGDPEDEDLDMLAETNVESFFTPTGNLGITARLHDRLQTGLAVQLSHEFRDRTATIETRMPDHPAYDNAEATGEQADIAISFPFYVRGGIRVIGERFDAEAAVVYQHWSVVDEVVADPGEVEITGVPGVDSVPVQELVVPQNFRNTFSAHFGGEYDLTDPIDLRAGYVFERGAVPDSHYSVFAIDPDKHQLSVGTSYHFGTDYDRLSLDVTAAALIMPSKTITNSEVRQINPSDEDGERSLIVGNGFYGHFGYIVGAGIRTKF